MSKSICARTILHYYLHRLTFVLELGFRNEATTTYFWNPKSLKFQFSLYAPCLYVAVARGLTYIWILRSIFSLNMRKTSIVNLTLCCKVSTLRKSDFLKHMKRVNRWEILKKILHGICFKNPDLTLRENFGGLGFNLIHVVEVECVIRNSESGFW